VPEIQESPVLSSAEKRLGWQYHSMTHIGNLKKMESLGAVEKSTHVLKRLFFF
jgi:hypothetical protein